MRSQGLLFVVAAWVVAAVLAAACSTTGAAGVFGSGDAVNAGAYASFGAR